MTTTTPRRNEHISPYDRPQALIDGDLIDITATAEGENLRLPTAISRRAYQELVTLHCQHKGEDPVMRLHQVCDALSAAWLVQSLDLPLIRTCIATYSTPTFAYFAEVWMLQEVNEDGERRWTIYLREEAV